MQYKVSAVDQERNIGRVLFAYQIACGRVEVGSIAYGWEVLCDDDLNARPPETEPEWRFSRIIAP